MRARRFPQPPRGFTLVELLVVVAITGILAAVGVHLFTSRLNSSQNAEAGNVIQALRAAEEAYRAENQSYLNVSLVGNAASASGSDQWYPTDAPSAARHEWHGCEAGTSPNTDCDRWKQLAPTVNTPVRFGYLVNAGSAGTAMVKPHTVVDPGLPTNPASQWYVLQAKGNVGSPAGSSSLNCGSNGIVCVVATSLNGEIYIEGD